MNIEEYRDYCLSFRYTSESFPFNDSVLVFKVLDKIFSLVDVESYNGVNVKCNPEKAIELREEYFGVTPAFHMSKKHWNTISVGGSISDNLIKEWIKDSYYLVVSKMPKKKQSEIG
jgi:predicted DNA-binding protein (MmcQ/YjbR family)